MYQHICIHTRGVPCPQCGWSFPMLTEMLWHKHLHSERQTFESSECDAVYHTLNSLRIHQIGKHSKGYAYEMCDRCFETPVQWAHHHKKCKSLWFHVWNLCAETSAVYIFWLGMVVISSNWGLLFSFFIPCEVDLSGIMSPVLHALLCTCLCIFFNSACFSPFVFSLLE